MNRAEVDEHLSQMATSWSDLLRAHRGTDAAAAEARGAILERYRTPIYRYLIAAARDREQADDLFQDFAVKLLRGDFHRADPTRGRFRDFLKTALYRMVVDARSRRRSVPMPDGIPEPVDDAPPPDDDRSFLEIWRAELFHRVWEELRHREEATGQPVHTVLRFRTDHPELRSAVVAERLAATLGRPVSAEWVRKWLHRGRKEFADRLVADVARSIGGDPSPDELEAELGALELLDACRDAVGAYRRSRGGHRAGTSGEPRSPLGDNPKNII